MDSQLENWHVTQGRILTGDGLLQRRSELFCDFLRSDLPHYHLQQGTSREVFQRWIKAGRRSDSIVGCWSRPLFSGGWQESTAQDTEAYNLQTPSLFIDMRFPIARPTSRLANKRSLAECSAEELRVLARQHCFAGYSLPDFAPKRPYREGEVITRHHVIDWNFHPRFPRPRPNRWWIEVQESKMSFKEFSVIRDGYGVPVYFERWQRRAPLAGQEQCYLAMRRRAPTGQAAALPDAILIVVGRHFALAVDRPPIDASVSLEGCQGAGAAFVDHLVRLSLLDTARAVLALEGSYGVLSSLTSREESAITAQEAIEWRIQKSTLPWKEGGLLFGPNTTFQLIRNHENRVQQITCQSSTEVCFDWDVVECTFSEDQLRSMFPNRPRSRL